MKISELLVFLRSLLATDVDVVSQMPTTKWTKPRLLVRRQPGTNARASLSTSGIRVVRQPFLLSLWTKDEGQGEDLMNLMELALWDLPGKGFPSFSVSDVETDGAQYAPEADVPEGYRHRHLMNLTFTGRHSA